jgi:predicted O-methyltransferase YrrM
MHTQEESEVLKALTRETHLKVLMPQMLSGKVQGNLLTMMSKMMQPKRILEIGTFTGYASICLAKGLANDGLLYTIDINRELETMTDKYFKQAGVRHQIVSLYGPAVQLIPTLEETFDLVFIDADKINYSTYYDLVMEKVRPGGLIIADNVLWSGKVVEATKDKDTMAMDAYNKKVQDDPRVENVLVPLRDGLMMARKK